MFHLIFWALGITGLGVLSAGNVDAGSTARSRVGFLLGWAVLFWLGALIPMVGPSRAWSIASFTVILGTLYLLGRPRFVFSKEDIFFSISLFLFSIVRTRWNQIGVIEDFPDYSIFQSLFSSPHYPPRDLWFSGHSINYYYLGHLLFVPVAKLMGISPNVAYGLGVATVLPLIFSLLLPYVRRAWHAFLFLLMGNLGFFFLFASDDRASWFWYTIRMIPHTITETPIYSFTQGNLHAHFLSLPITLLVALTIVEIGEKSSFVRRWRSFLVGLGMGIHFFLSSWTVIPLLILLLVRLRLKPRLSFFELGALVVGMVVGMAPSFITLKLPPIHFALVLPSDRTPFVHFWMHWAPLFVPLTGVALQEFWKRPWKTRVVELLFALVIGSLLGPTLSFLVWLGYTFLKDEKNIWIVSAIVVLISAEIFYFRDDFAYSDPPIFRLNTAFKFFYVSWAFLLFAMPSVWARIKNPFRLIAIAVVAVSILPLLVLLVKKPTWTKPTFDGTRWIKEYQPNSMLAIQWLQSNAIETDVLIEGVKMRRPSTAMFSTFAGIPTVLGWPTHEKLWRPQDLKEVMTREEDIKTIYTTSDVQKLNRLIRRYKASYIVVGPEEQEIYKIPIIAAVYRLPKILKVGKVQILDARKGDL